MWEVGRDRRGAVGDTSELEHPELRLGGARCGNCHLQCPSFVLGQVEVAQLVSVAIDSVRGLPGPSAAEHLGLDGDTDVAEQTLVALERTTPRGMARWVLVTQLVDDVVERQRDACFEEQRQQVRRALQLISHVRSVGV